MSRHQERDRSRDRHGYRGRSQSSDSYEKKKRTPHQSLHHPPSAPVKRRVKFNDISDVKIFRKDDEPNGKGLTDNDIEEYMKKLEIERGSNNFHNFNWEKMKHHDAQLQNNSIKQVQWWINQQKQREKVLCERLQSITQQISFYTPLLLKVMEELSPGEGSSEREGLGRKLNNVLGCFYVEQSQIPGEPAFQIQNRAPCISPKLISFHKYTINNNDLTNNSRKTNKQFKPIKGILKGFSDENTIKRSTSQPRRIDPALITLLKEINNNKTMYSKEKTQMLLQPYKLSGQLEYLKNNPIILSSLFRQPEQPIRHQVQPLRSSISPSRMPDPYKPRSSISPQVDRPPAVYSMPHPSNQIPQYQQYAQYQNYPPYGPYGQYQNYSNNIQPQKQPHNQEYQHMQPQPFNPYQSQNQMQSDRHFKTVPCKYFHSPQGCVKASGCTFIHDEQYPGVPTPSMLKSNRGMVNSYGQEMGEPGMNQTYYEYPGYGDGRRQ